MRTMKRKAKSLIIKHEISFTRKSPHEKAGFTVSYGEAGCREIELVKLIANSLPLFALSERELKECIENDELSSIQEKALARISQARKDKKGDYGEALLFILLSAFYDNERIVTKLKLRSCSSEQIKGFDCANFTCSGDDLIVWLGEVKFYKRFSSALRDVLNELCEHTKSDYIKGEFRILLPNCEINRDSPVRDKVLSVLDGSIPLKKVKFKFPVLLTCTASQLQKFQDESSEDFLVFIQKYFSRKFSAIESIIPKELELFDIVFFVFPMQDVSLLKTNLDNYEKALEA